MATVLTHNYDAIVIGTGGVGSAALYHLAARGVRAVGLDRFHPAHDRGSSHGQTRIIRQAYFEHPDYVPLLRRAYELWSDLELVSGRQLYHETGLLEIGPPDGVVLPGVLTSAQLHGLEVEQLSAQDVSVRFPGFEMPTGYGAVFEKRAGYLLVEECVRTHLVEAQKLGAVLHTEQAVQRWELADSAVLVHTDSERYSASRLIVAAGAWTNQLLSDLGVDLTIVLKHLHWYASNDPTYRQDQGCPTFFYEMANGYFYGFPQIDSRGVKVAEHSGGTTVDNPLKVDRGVDTTDRRRVEQFLAQSMPGVSTTHAGHTTCFYTKSADEHFIVDRHPEHDQVVLAAGLSGHGFKFTCVLGEVLADLALDGRSNHPIQFLRSTRPGLIAST